MGKIDTFGWKEFRVGELFAQERGKEKAPKQNEPGDCPLIQETNNNNGFDRMVVPTKIIKGNSITVSINYAQNVFYQEDDFCASVNIAVLRNSHLNRYNSQFVCSVLRNAHQKFDYTSKISKELLNKEMIMLPVDKTGQPDWAYMESYMANIETRVAESMTMLQAAKDAEKKKVDTREWGSFALGTLFNIVKGKRLTKAEMKSGKTPFIGSSALNNGCTAMIGNDKNQHPENTITVCYNGSVGETFYQDQPYIASDDVNVLYPKFTMNRQIALFIVPLIKGVSSRYDYIDKWKKEAMEADKIYLPVDKNGDPDWDYMEEYMKMVQGKTERVLNQFISA